MNEILEKRYLVPVVGNYYTSAQGTSLYRRLKVDDTVTLIFEPLNKFDVNAISVWTFDKNISKNLIKIGMFERNSALRFTADVNEVFSLHNLSVIDRSFVTVEATVIKTSDSDGRLVIKPVKFVYKTKEV